MYKVYSCLLFRGSTHKCSLCFTTCPNLIEYGKHLNGDKHKQAIEEGRVQRETLDPQEIHYRLQSGQVISCFFKEFFTLKNNAYRRCGPKMS